MGRNTLARNTLIIHHANCWDGFCAAWIMSREQSGTLYAAHYGTEPPNVKGMRVLMVDFAYPRDVLLRMAEEASEIVVLDHHKTAQDALAGLPFCTFDMSKSGGRLAWEYCRGDDPSPWLVDYTEDRDLWRHALPHSREINAALRSYPLSLDLWDEFSLDPELPARFVAEGSAIRRREQQIVEDHVRNAREIEMAGHRILAVNATVLFSDIAGDLARDRPFGACYFDRADGKRQWSLRSREGGVDVSAIAKAMGGGGHPAAAGFEEAAP